MKTACLHLNTFWDREWIGTFAIRSHGGGLGKSNPVVAVVDLDGAALTKLRAHPENLNVLDFRDLRAKASEEVPDTSHALACASIIAGVNGVAPRLPLVLVGASPDAGQQADILRWLTGLPAKRALPPQLASPPARWADVVLLSLLLWDEPVLAEALAELFHQGRGGKGVLVSLAAGNQGCPQAQPLARFGYCLTVGATCLGKNGSEDVAPYSNYGCHVDLFAPSGACAGRSYREPRDKIVAAALPFPASMIQEEDDGLLRFQVGTVDDTLRSNYSLESGTSTSAALCAGVAALMLRANPLLTALEVKEILRHTAKKISTPAHGEIRRLEAAAAVAAARRHRRHSPEIQSGKSSAD